MTSQKKRMFFWTVKISNPDFQKHFIEECFENVCGVAYDMWSYFTYTYFKKSGRGERRMSIVERRLDDWKEMWALNINRK